MQEQSRKKEKEQGKVKSKRRKVKEWKQEEL